MADAARFAYRRGAAALSDQGGTDQAARALRDAMERSGTNEANVAARMQQAQAAGVPLTMAESISQQVRTF